MENMRNYTRKDFLKKSATGLVVITAGFGLAKGAVLNSLPMKGSYVKKLSSVTAQAFREGVMPRAQLSKAACEIALTRAKNKNVKQFTEWELMEATTVIKVLEDGGTPISPLGADSKNFLTKLGSLSNNQFDNEFMRAQLSNHVFLKDLAQDFIDGYDKDTIGKQEIGHVSNLALFAFTEHVGLCKDIIVELS